ncbi:pantoate--beta-alanine ligase [Alkalihalobacillus sp. 1P02AB]|uniref:pantoate--beta-alanine ligase n=1 Tax=Alkalihalobacillus sp. 1P02AB TaxID=3132260 RepID=UPI0039A534B2
MRTFRTKKETLTEIGLQKVKGKTIGYVATMGFLHEGHLQLVAKAKEQCDVVVMSIFVNPLQFGPNEDFERYPRDEKRDSELAEKAGVDYLFYPTVEEMYPEEQMMEIRVTQGTDVLCGASRPGHFDGVAVVVMKLFQIVQPNKAFFGLKDAQQVAVIENMVRAFDIPVEVIRCETVREEDGLAKSSRNVYLSDEERKLAPQLYQTLLKGCELVLGGTTERDQIISFLTSELNGLSLGKLDYTDVLSFPSLKAEKQLTGEVIIALAYQFKQARLIDNVIVRVGEEL